MKTNMAPNMDRLKLTSNKLFQTFRRHLLEENVPCKARQILNALDDTLFVWDFKDRCVLTSNLSVSTVKDEQPSYQRLLLTNSPSFDVEELSAGPAACRVLVCGPRGISVLELPKRWGSSGLYLGGKETITCRSFSLDERLFACSPQLELRQIRWHPGSSMDSHVAALMSDNTLRIYALNAEGSILMQAISLGRRPASTPSGRLPVLVSLGETAVSFDFGAPTVQEGLKDDSTDQGTHCGAFLWPIVILRGNGDVYIVETGLGQHRPLVPEVQGPVSMYPPADDNYGVDACSVLCLGSTPMTVVIATCSGVLHHGVLLPCSDTIELPSNENQDKENLSLLSTRFGSSTNITGANVALHVFDSVELELGISLDDAEGNDYSCPIRLYSDITSPARYFCYHDTGVHSVTLPLIPQLEELAAIADDDVNSIAPFSRESIVEYVLCTRVGQSGPVGIPQGMVCISVPSALVVLQSSGEVVSQPLTRFCHPTPAPPCLIGSDSPVVKSAYKDPFDAYVCRLLARAVSQPLISTESTKNLTAQESLELIARSTQIFREHYIQKQNEVREEFERRVRSLIVQKNQQGEDLAELAIIKAQLTSKAEEIAEKYEDTKDRMDSLTKRTEIVLQQASFSQPVVSTAERKYLRELHDVEMSVKHLTNMLKQVHAKHEYYKRQVEQCRSNEKKGQQVTLKDNQIQSIKEALIKQGDDMLELVKGMSAVMKDLGM